MSEPLYDAIIRTNFAKLGVIMQALNKEKDVQLIIVQQASVTNGVTPTPTIPPPTAKQYRYAGGKKDKGISGRDLMLQLLANANGAMSISKLADAFVARGFARHTASPVASDLMKEKVIEQVGPGLYRLIKKEPGK